LDLSIYHLEDLLGLWSHADGAIQVQVSEMFLAVYAHIASQDQQRGALELARK
jgi:hypothetical protein